MRKGEKVKDKGKGGREGGKGGEGGEGKAGERKVKDRVERAVRGEGRGVGKVKERGNKID